MPRVRTVEPVSCRKLVQAYDEFLVLRSLVDADLLDAHGHDCSTHRLGRVPYLRSGIVDVSVVVIDTWGHAGLRAVPDVPPSPTAPGRRMIPVTRMVV